MWGHGCGIWTLPLSPLWRFWPQSLPQTVVLFSPERGILSNLSYFLVPRVRNLTKKLQKQERKEKSNARTMPVTPLHSVQTLIPTLMVTCYAFNLWALRPKTSQCVMALKKIRVSKKTRQFYDSLVSPVTLMLLYSEKNTAFSSIPKREILLEKPHRWPFQIYLQQEPYSLELQGSKSHCVLTLAKFFPYLGLKWNSWLLLYTIVQNVFSITHKKLSQCDTWIKKQQ